ncbi:MAG: magnesium transporter [Xanthomonadales bacterium]|nr:magnesium transporter [Xanthomonadales bacterium]
MTASAQQKPPTPPESPHSEDLVTAYDEVVVRAGLAEALAASDGTVADSLLAVLPVRDQLRLVLQLSAADRAELFSMLPPESAAHMLEGLPDLQAVDVLEDLPASAAALIMDELDSADQVDLLAELDDQDAESILQAMDPESAADARKLVDYDPETAGGLMEPDPLFFRADARVGDVLRGLIDHEDEFDSYRGQHPYVVDEHEQLVGVMSLRILLTSQRSALLSQVMVPAISLALDTSLDAMEDFFEEHSYLGAPVVDHEQRLVGVVSRQSVNEASLEKAEGDALKTQGVVGDELRSMPTWFRAQRRLLWLSANVVLNVIAASVISAYEETLAAVITLAVFLPMVSDMSGCSGNQAVAVTMRELSIGVVKPRDVFRVWLKEISVGMINGLALGLLIGLVAWVWKGNPVLGAVIGGALMLNTMIAVSIGGTVPLILKRFGVDPAVASGPLLTTITDMAGFFLVLGLAAWSLPYLT